MSTKKEELLREMEKSPLATYKDLEDKGYHWSTIESLINEGQAEKLSRGVYSLVERDVEQWETLAYTALRYPKSVICLLSAARFHEMTSANPPNVWLALPHGSRRPNDPNVTIKAKMWRNPKLFELGVEETLIAGVPVRITNPARTIVDLFRPYNNMTDERCNEALWYFIDNGGDMDCLHDYAREFGVEDVISKCVRMASCRVM